MRWKNAILLAAVLFFGCTGDNQPPLPKRIVDLSPVLVPELPVRQLGSRVVEFLGIPPRLGFTPVKPVREDHAYGLALFTLPSQVGAHVDPPGRLLKQGARVDEIPLNRLVGTGRVVDLRWKSQTSMIQASDLEHFPIERGDVVVLFVGYEPPAAYEWPRYPSLSMQAAEWLARKQIAALLTDAPSIANYRRYAELMDKGSPVEEVWAERLVLFRSGIPVVEGLVNIGELLGERRLLIVVLPLPVAERSGAPARVVALLY